MHQNELHIGCHHVTPSSYVATACHPLNSLMKTATLCTTSFKTGNTDDMEKSEKKDYRDLRKFANLTHTNASNASGSGYCGRVSSYER